MKTDRYAGHTLEAAKLLGAQIRIGRLERRWTAHELAERIGISVVTLRKIEQGDPSVRLGFAFEAATLTGVQLFEDQRPQISAELRRAGDRLSVLPNRVRQPREINDDF